MTETHNNIGIAAAHVDRAAFISAMRMVPGTIAIVAAADGEDRTGMAATAWASLSADPPSLLICINLSASANALIERTGTFSVSVVTIEDTETVAIFSGQRGLNGRDRFESGRWVDGNLGLPLLTSSVMACECRATAHHVYGTHSVFFGDIFSLVSTAGATPLLYADGGFARAERLAAS